MNAPAPTPVRSDGVPTARVLVIEDNFLVGMRMVGLLDSLGYSVVGPIASLHEGLRLAREQTWEAAVLDVNIIGGTSELIARELDARGIPFIFVTGYASPFLISDRIKKRLRLSKPVTIDQLKIALSTKIDLDEPPTSTRPS